MAQSEVHLNARVRAPLADVFAFFADHERFITLFGGRCQRIRDAEGTDPNGLGSVRRIGPGPLSFDETIVTFRPGQRIEYSITRGSPLKNHLGTIDFSERGGYTEISYVIRCEGKLPCVAPAVGKALALAWKLNAQRRLAVLER